MARRLYWTLCALLAGALPASASDALAGSYWSGFTDFWLGSLRKQNGIVLMILGVGAVCLFIITRSKAKK